MRASLTGLTLPPGDAGAQARLGAPHSSMGRVIDRVAPKVGMIAECLPGPPATITIRSSGLAQSATSSARSRRSEEHTSELQSLAYLVCRLLLEKKKKKIRH